MPAVPASAAQLAAANPSAGKVAQLPQTTGAKVAGGPFVRYSEPSFVQAFTLTGQAFGTPILQTLKPVGGYVSALQLLVQAVGGAGATGTSVAIAADAPYNGLGSTMVRDPYGQPAYQVSTGYHSRLIQMYSGQAQWRQYADPANQSNQFSAASTGASGTGDFTFPLTIPFEADSAAYGSLPSMNASIQPSFQTTLASSATVYSTAPPTVPTITLEVDQEYWAIPESDRSLAPPDVGTTLQWREVPGLQSIPSGGTTRVEVPMGSAYLTTIILVARDSTNARADIWGTNITFWLDGVPVRDNERVNYRQDLMLSQFGVTRPTGVLVYSRRASVQQAVSSADTFDLALSTTPGTLLEFSGPWGTISNAPANLIALVGALYPRSGHPYTHLAEV